MLNKLWPNYGGAEIQDPFNALERYKSILAEQFSDLFAIFAHPHMKPNKNPQKLKSMIQQ